MCNYSVKRLLIGLCIVVCLDIEYRWVEEYFPFTHPSWELEIMYQGNWIEVLGCGVIRQEILRKGNKSNV